MSSLFSSSSLLSCFAPHIVSLSSCPSYAVRVVAAKALVPFIPTERLLDTAKELVARLPSGLAAFSQNSLHGTLLQIRILLEAAKLYSSDKSDSGFLREMLNKIWICTARNPCSLTRAAFLSIITSFGLPFGRDFESGKFFCFLALSVYFRHFKWLVHFKGNSSVLSYYIDITYVGFGIRGLFLVSRKIQFKKMDLSV